MLLDPLHGRKYVPRRFAVHGYPVASCVGEGVYVADWVVYHQMGIEELVGVPPHSLDNWGSEGDVGDEHPVHHIEMDPIRACAVCPGDLFAESREVCG